MNSESHTHLELYETLKQLGIPVLQPDGNEPRSVSDLISDLFRVWKDVSDIDMASRIIGALQWISRTVEFDDAQKLMLEVAASETEEARKKACDAERKRIQRESDRALNEFLAGFRIIGGDGP